MYPSPFPILCPIYYSIKTGGSDTLLPGDDSQTMWSVLNVWCHVFFLIPSPVQELFKCFNALFHFDSVLSAFHFIPFLPVRFRFELGFGQAKSINKCLGVGPHLTPANKTKLLLISTHSSLIWIHTQKPECVLIMDLNYLFGTSLRLRVLCIFVSGTWRDNYIWRHSCCRLIVVIALITDRKMRTRHVNVI